MPEGSPTPRSLVQHMRNQLMMLDALNERLDYLYFMFSTLESTDGVVDSSTIPNMAQSIDLKLDRAIGRVTAIQRYIDNSDASPKVNRL